MYNDMNQNQYPNQGQFQNQYQYQYPQQPPESPVLSVIYGIRNYIIVLILLCIFYFNTMRNSWNYIGVDRPEKTGRSGNGDGRSCM